jgi:hypothetical protein
MNSIRSSVATEHRTNSVPGRKFDRMPFRPESPDSSSTAERALSTGVRTWSAARPSISDAALEISARQWMPPPLDLVNVSPARIRDFYLGGDRSFAVDRE